MGNVRCTGSEQRLIDCPYTNNTFRNDCTHGQDVAVYCQPSTTHVVRTKFARISCNFYTMLALQCEEGDLRLTGGSTVNQGRVEVCMNETWGTICSTNWGQTEANVACRQLGFSQHGTCTCIMDRKPLTMR